MRDSHTWARLGEKASFQAPRTERCSVNAWVNLTSVSEGLLAVTYKRTLHALIFCMDSSEYISAFRNVIDGVRISPALNLRGVSGAAFIGQEVL